MTLTTFGFFAFSLSLEVPFSVCSPSPSTELLGGAPGVLGAATVDAGVIGEGKAALRPGAAKSKLCCGNLNRCNGQPLITLRV